MWGTRLRRPLFAVVGAVGAIVLVFGTVDYMLAVPGSGFVGALPGLRLLDYSRLVGELSPLTDAFVRKQLHLNPSAGLATPPAGGQTGPGQPIGTTGGFGGPGSPASRGIDVSHSFTNDDFRDAYGVPGVPFTARTRTSGQTRQRGEPTSCARSGGTAWYRYDAPQTATLEADTFGTTYADTLGVFSGTSLSDLHQVGCSSSPLGNAQVAFTAAANTTYYFQITGRFGDGRLRFHLGPLGRTDLGSVTSAGEQANGDTVEPFLSSTGRYLAFESGAPNMSNRRDLCSNVPLATTQCGQVYLRDLLTGTTRLVSYLPGGQPAPGISFAPSVTADGRYVAFLSAAVGLLPELPQPGTCVGETVQFPRTAGRTVLCVHLYLRDMQTGRLILVSRSAGGRPSNGMEFNYSLAANGKYIAFLSDATNLIPGLRIPTCNPVFYVGDQTGGGTHCTQTYLWRADTHALKLVSVRRDGSASMGHSTNVDVSADGRTVVFGTDDNGVSSDSRIEPFQFIYARDMLSGKTRMICYADGGGVPNRPCVNFTPFTGQFMSANGRYVAFWSPATNLTAQSADVDRFGAYYVRDLVNGTLVRVDVSNTGQGAQGIAAADSIVMSGDGRWVAFVSSATNLVTQNTGQHIQVYLHDMTTGATVLASLSSAGRSANGDSSLMTLSHDGALLAFDSVAGNLTGRDANAGLCPGDIGGNCGDVFVHVNVDQAR